MIPGLKRRQAILVACGAIAGAVGMWGLSSGKARIDGDVRAFGARGDGRHDDTAAVQRAIDSDCDVLWFPTGQYRLTAALRPRSGQIWRGNGPFLSQLIAGGSANQPPFNLVQAAIDDPLEAFAIGDLGFRGARDTQVSYSRTGQEGFALYLRTALSDISLRNCLFENLGDGRSGGGGVVLGPRPDQKASNPSNIVVENCVFSDNGNVPGLYISASRQPESAGSGIRISGNSFGGTVGSTKVQNCIYILGGGSQGILRHVDVSHNRFDFSTAVDAAIELNWVENFTISTNSLHFQAAMMGSSAILIRDGSANGVVSGNTITSASPEISLRGILVLNFAHPAQISNLAITGNIISGVAGAISADRGATGVQIAHNHISGRNDENGFGIRVVDASNIHVDGNLITAMNQAVILGHGDQPESALSDVVVERNHFSHCGGGGRALIAAVYSTPDHRMRDLILRDNSTSSTIAGSIEIDPVLLMDGAALP